MDLGEIYREIEQRKKDKREKIKIHRDIHNIKCRNCNRKIVAINKDFKSRPECKTCYMANYYERELRRNKY